MAKTKTIENLFVYLDIYSSLIPIVFFIIYWKKSSPLTGFRFLVAYSVLFFIINWLLLRYNSNLLYESFTIMEFILFVGFLHTQIQNKKARKTLFITGCMYLVFYISYTLTEKTGVSIDSIQIGVETIIILVFSYYYLYERMNDTTTLFIYNTYQFWVVLGIVLYLSGSFFVYLFAEYISYDEMKVYWPITNVLSIIKSILFSVAIYINTKPIKNTLTSDFEISSLN